MSTQFDDVKLYAKWKKDTSATLPDMEAGKDANNYVNENITATIGKIVHYLDDYSTFKSHGHALTDSGITGTLPVNKGGTGAQTLESGKAVIGNGTNAVTFKVIDSVVTSGSDNLVTSGAVKSAIDALGNVFNVKSVGTYSSVTALPTTGNHVGDVHLINIDTPDYELTTSEPSDWSSNYKAYYTESSGVYSHVTGDSAPTWAADTYYVKTDNDEYAEYVWIEVNNVGQWEYFGRLQVEINDASTSTKGLVTLATGIGSTASTPSGTAVVTPNQVVDYVTNQGYVTSSGVTSITAGTGLSGGTIDESGTIAINFGNSGESQLAARADHVHDNVLYTTDNITINCITDDPTTAVRYGVRIAKNDSNPRTRVTYMYDAVGFTPAKMVYNTSNPEQSYFSYGSWADVFFVRNNYPCMCRYDGTEDYELSHQDHTKKIDGTDSDVTDMTYAGNAQSCFDCKIWLWHHEDADYEYYEISNVQYNENFHLNAYVRADGTVADKVYFPMYKGSYDGTRLRSMSSPTVLTYEYTEHEYSEAPTNWPNGYYSDTNGTAAPSTFTAGTYYTRTDDGVYPQNKTTSTNEISYCNANGEKWQIGDWAHRELLNALLVLISKSDNSQEAFGQGCTEGGADNALIHYGFPKNGSLNMKGQFFGYSSTRKAVKVFYIENWWGTRWDRCLGLFNHNGEYKVKWTPPYSNTSTTGCISTGIAVPTSNGSYQKATSNTYGRLPISVGGSSSTYTCDGFWSNNAQLNLAICGGLAGYGSSCGAWFVRVGNAPSDSGWALGASPYLK